VSERYPRLLATIGRTSGWRILLGLFLAAVVLVSSGVAVVFLASAGAALVGVHDPFSRRALGVDQPLGLLANNLSIAMITPSVVLAVLVAHRARPGWLASVAGRLRWSLLVRFCAIALVVVGIAFLASMLVPGQNAGVVHIPGAGRLTALLVVIALSTPLQAAGEEFGFRGYLTQLIAARTARPVLGAVAAGAVTATLFALAHGTQDPWLFSDRLAFGLVASWLAWRTGGLEASIALHIATNVTSLGYSAVTGSLDDTLHAATLDWSSAVIDITSILLFAVVVDRCARRWHIVVRREVGPSGADDPTGSSDFGSVSRGRLS
jgi:membrane protease YdiL (CAAX protease family)